jgi:hypothetical protein
MDYGLKIREKATVEIPTARGTRCTQVHIPAVEDRYILLAIWYIITTELCLSNMLYILSDVPLGAPLPDFIYATRLRFTSVLVEYILELPFFISKLI